jgi:hypothetical protein
MRTSSCAYPLLVVLEASPVADVQDTATIATVIYRGHVLDRQALQGKITQGFAPEGLR